MTGHVHQNWQFQFVRKFGILFTGKKPTSSLPPFFKYCIDIWNLLFFMQKIKFIPHLFTNISLNYCKIFILGTLEMSHQAQQKQYINLQEALMFIYI